MILQYLMWPRINRLINHGILLVVTLFVGLGRPVSGPGVDLLVGVQLSVHRAHHLLWDYVGHWVTGVFYQVAYLRALKYIY